MSTKRVGLAISITVALLAWASQGSLHLPVGIPPSWDAIIESWASFLMSIYLTVNVFLPADVIGPLKPQPPIASSAVQAMKGTDK